MLRKRQCRAVEWDIKTEILLGYSFHNKKQALAAIDERGVLVLTPSARTWRLTMKRLK
jgi:hypothetical protein